MMARRLAIVLLVSALTGAASAAGRDASKPAAPDELRLMPAELLGKRLFEDANLSEPRGVSCASCHDPAAGFRGNNHSAIPALAAGSRPGVVGDRKTPSLLYAAYSPPFAFVVRLNDMTGLPETVPVGGQFWDGRADDLAAQVEGPLLNPREMNNASRQAVVAKVRDSAYAKLARDVFGEDVLDRADAFDKLASAIATYEATPRFKPFSSKFDDWLEGKMLLSDQEYRGFQLFIDKTKGNCLSCHDGGGDNEYAPGSAPRDPNAPLSRNPKNWLFTDFSFDALGAPRNAAIPDNADANRFDMGLCARKDLAARAPAGYDIASLCGQFKTPSLRNVALNAPYMHNGAFATLRDAVAFYFTRDTEAARWYPRDADGAAIKFDDLPPGARDNVNTKQPPYDRKPGQPPRATDAEIDDIVAFLRTLTDAPFVEKARAAER